MKAPALLIPFALVTACKPSSDPSAVPRPGTETSTRTGAKGNGELRFYTFPEYHDPEIVEEYERRTNTRVRISYYESTEEMLAKLQHADGASQYDVVVVSQQTVPVMARLGLLRKLDHAKIPNLQNLASRFRTLATDPGNEHSVAYQWGTVGIIYDKKKHPSVEPTWGLIFDEKKRAGTFLMIDEMRDQMGAALAYLGCSINSTVAEEVKKAGELVLDAKKSSNSLGFEGGVGAKNRVASGLVDFAVVWNGDAIKAMSEDAEGRLGFIFPREGSVLWADVMVITAKGPNPDAAHAFVDHILEPKTGARLSNFNKFATPNQSSMTFINPQDAANPALYPSEEQLGKVQYLRDLGDGTRLYDEVWTAVKAR
ncbi:MAG: spermidine/putrescine ABC transporter substrate-binding protein [Deltaproteobacteria bacterium]|nr:spermidine/putrescine ABC transporter substrate-binding protein [Deltaproteobacteria bacterium]